MLSNNFRQRLFFSTNHKDFGNLYFVFGILSGVIGTFFSIIILFELYQLLDSSAFCNSIKLGNLNYFYDDLYYIYIFNFTTLIEFQNKIKKVLVKNKNTLSFFLVFNLYRNF